MHGVAFIVIVIVICPLFMQEAREKTTLKAKRKAEKEKENQAPKDKVKVKVTAAALAKKAYMAAGAEPAEVCTVAEFCELHGAGDGSIFQKFMSCVQGSDEDEVQGSAGGAHGSALAVELQNEHEEHATTTTSNSLKSMRPPKGKPMQKNKKKNDIKDKALASTLPLVLL